jgi:hypothetical protein
LSDLAFQLIAAAIDLGQIVVGQLAPLLLDFALHFFPISFDSVSVHLPSPNNS